MNKGERGRMMEMRRSKIRRRNREAEELEQRRKEGRAEEEERRTTEGGAEDHRRRSRGGGRQFMKNFTVTFHFVLSKSLQSHYINKDTKNKE